MGPFDYSLNIGNPLQSILQGYQLGQQMQQQRLAQQQAEQQQIAAQQKSQAMSSLMRPGVGFGDYMRVGQMFPEESKALMEQWQAMDKMGRDTMFNAAADAYTRLKPNDTGGFDGAAALAKLEEYAVAAENTGDKAAAQKLREMAQFVKTDPVAGRATIGMSLAVLDKDRAKGLLEAEFGPIDTATVKNLIAEGIRPGTPEFKAAMNEERRKITVTLPGGGFFSGPPERLQEILGGAPPQDAQRGSLPQPKSKAEFDALPPGTSFIDPDGKVRTKLPALNDPKAMSSAPIQPTKPQAAMLRKQMGDVKYEAWLRQYGLKDNR